VVLNAHMRALIRFAIAATINYKRKQIIRILNLLFHKQAEYFIEYFKYYNEIEGK